MGFMDPSMAAFTESLSKAVLTMWRTGAMSMTPVSMAVAPASPLTNGCHAGCEAHCSHALKSARHIRCLDSSIHRGKDAYVNARAVGICGPI